MKRARRYTIPYLRGQSSMGFGPVYIIYHIRPLVYLLSCSIGTTQRTCVLINRGLGSLGIRRGTCSALIPWQICPLRNGTIPSCL